MASPQSVQEQVGNLLERGYSNAASQVLKAMGRELESGIIAQRLAELDAEALRLAAAGEKLSPDNPVLRTVIADMESVLRRNQQRVTDVAADMAIEGVRAANEGTYRLTMSNVPDNTIRNLWNQVDPEAVGALTDFTQDADWNNLMGGYTDEILERLKLKATFGFTQGWGPRRTAAALRQLAVGMPVSRAETLMRTLYLQSYRRGTAASHLANADILAPSATRIAVLDRRTCLACVVLHGSRVPLGSTVKDHYNGRCTVIASVRGFEREIQSGIAWFEGLPEERQRGQRAFMVSPASWDAYKAGEVTLNDFVGEMTDPVFGEMIYQSSLKGILGDGARRFYQNGEPHP